MLYSCNDKVLKSYTDEIPHYPSLKSVGITLSCGKKI